MFSEMLRKWQSNPNPEAPYEWQTILKVLVSPSLNKRELATSLFEKLKSNERSKLQYYSIKEKSKLITLLSITNIY